MSCQRRTSPGNIDWGSPNFGSERSVELFCCKLLLTETTTSFSICERLWIRHWLFSPRARSRKARKVLFPLIHVLNERPPAKIIKTRNYKAPHLQEFQQNKFPAGYFFCTFSCCLYLQNYGLGTRYFLRCVINTHFLKT